MLILSRIHLDAMVEHALTNRATECCGVIAGPIGSDVPVRWIPMENAAESATFFRFDAAEQLRVWREMDHAGEEPVVIYHSHVYGGAYPSREDVQYAHEPNAHYVIVDAGPQPMKVEERLRSFRIIGERVIEETIRFIDPVASVTRPATSHNPIGALSCQ